MSYDENSRSDSKAIDHGTDRIDDLHALETPDTNGDPEGSARRGEDLRVPAFLRDKFAMAADGKRFVATREYIAVLTEYADAALGAMRASANACEHDAVAKLVEAHDALHEVADGAAYGFYRAMASQAAFGLQRLVGDLSTAEELNVRGMNDELSESAQDFQATLESRIDSAKTEIPVWLAAANALGGRYEPEAQVGFDAKAIARKAADQDARYNTERFLYGSRSATAVEPSQAKAEARRLSLALLG